MSIAATVIRAIVISSIAAAVIRAIVISSIAAAVIRTIVVSSIAAAVIRTIVISSIAATVIRAIVVLSIAATVIRAIVISSIAAAVIRAIVISSIAAAVIRTIVVSSIAAAVIRTIVISSIAATVIRAIVVLSIAAAVIRASVVLPIPHRSAPITVAVTVISIPNTLLSTRNIPVTDVVVRIGGRIRLGIVPVRRFRPVSVFRVFTDFLFGHRLGKFGHIRIVIVKKAFAESRFAFGFCFATNGRIGRVPVRLDFVGVLREIFDLFVGLRRFGRSLFFGQRFTASSSLRRFVRFLLNTFGGHKFVTPADSALKTGLAGIRKSEGFVLGVG